MFLRQKHVVNSLMKLAPGLCLGKTNISLSVGVTILSHLIRMQCPSLKKMNKSLSILRVVGCFFYTFIKILIEHSVSKQ